MKFRIIEELEDPSANRGHSRGELDYLLTPGGGFTIQDVEQALENRDLYGSYLANTRDKASVAKAVEDHFGPTLPTKKKPLEKLRGKPFPPKTRDAMDAFLKTMEGKPNLLTYELKGDKLLFPKDKNHSQLATANILKQVLGAAGIKYKLEKFENLAEYSKPLQEIKRMQKLAGITEIKVNNPIQIKFEDIKEGNIYEFKYTLSYLDNGAEKIDKLKVGIIDSIDGEEFLLVNHLDLPDFGDSFELHPEDIISIRQV